MGAPKVVLLLFASGKLVITGAKHEDMVTEAIEKLNEILEDYNLIYYN
jgi:transcription initiation factor TFIID TATA-box-binding protein